MNVIMINIVIIESIIIIMVILYIFNGDNNDDDKINSRSNNSINCKYNKVVFRNEKWRNIKRHV